MSSGKEKIPQIGMEQGRVSMENAEASSQIGEEQMLRVELNTL
jgi:hypothetical protein